MNFLDIMQAGGNTMAAASGVTNVTDESVSDVIDSAAEATNEAAQEVNQFVQLVQDNIPNIIGFGIKVILALVFFFLGSKVIKWLRKIAGRSFERTNVDAGVAQFVDSMLKFGLYALLIFMIATNFGIESSSIAALIASAGVAVGLALQGSLSNFAGGILILLLKPFAVGDYIVVTQEGIEGTVKEIQIFYTKLATVDNQRVVVPNSILTSNSLTNVTARPERQLVPGFAGRRSGSGSPRRKARPRASGLPSRGTASPESRYRSSAEHKPAGAAGRLGPLLFSRRSSPR